MFTYSFTKQVKHLVIVTFTKQVPLYTTPTCGNAAADRGSGGLTLQSRSHCIQHSPVGMLLQIEEAED